MIYEEYEAIRKKIQEKEEKLFKLLDKRDRIFSMTQPKSSKFDKEMVDGKNPINTIEEYIIQDEQQQLSVQITQLNLLLDDWYQALKRKRDELKQSKNIYDRIYYLRIIEKVSPAKIAYLIPCDRATVYRYMQDLCNNAKGLRNELYSIRSYKQNKQ